MRREAAQATYQQNKDTSDKLKLGAGQKVAWSARLA